MITTKKTYPADAKSPHSVEPVAGLCAGETSGLVRTLPAGGGAILFIPPGGGGRMPPVPLPRPLDVREDSPSPFFCEQMGIW